MDHDKALPLINKIKEEVKNSKTIRDLFKKYKIDLDEIDLVPVCFKDDLEVSARTEHAVIYLNINLLEKPKEIAHYLAHELTHVIQQTTGDGPTQGSAEDDYLDNPAEIQGFQNQTKFISETKGDDAAKAYVEKVVKHHDLSGKEKKEKRKELLQLASEQLKLFKKKPCNEEKLTKSKKELDKEFEEAIARGPEKNHSRPINKKLHPLDQGERVKRLKKILEKIKD